MADQYEYKQTTKAEKAAAAAEAKQAESDAAYAAEVGDQPGAAYDSRSDAVKAADANSNPNSRGDQPASPAQYPDPQQERRDSEAASAAGQAQAANATERQRLLNEADAFYRLHPTREQLEASFAEQDKRAEGRAKAAEKAESDKKKTAEKAAKESK